jgi:hypothetical protein
MVTERDGSSKSRSQDFLPSKKHFASHQNAKYVWERKRSGRIYRYKSDGWSTVRNSGLVMGW